MAAGAKQKMKTHKGAQKRFRKTGTGKFKRTQNNLSHINTKKSRNRKRRLRQLTLVNPADERKIRALLPYA